MPLSQRIAQHRQEYKRFMDGTNKQYSLLHKVMDSNDYEVILLEKNPCQSKEELTARTLATFFLISSHASSVGLEASAQE